MDRWARLAHRRRGRVIGVWATLIVALIVGDILFGGKFVTAFSLPGSESQAAIDLLEEKFPQRSGDEGDIVFEAAVGAWNRPRLSRGSRPSSPRSRPFRTSSPSMVRSARKGSSPTTGRSRAPLSAGTNKATNSTATTSPSWWTPSMTRTATASASRPAAPPFTTMKLPNSARRRLVYSRL
jgi:hypothetical protein